MPLVSAPDHALLPAGLLSMMSETLLSNINFLTAFASGFEYDVFADVIEIHWRTLLPIEFQWRGLYDLRGACFGLQYCCIG